MDSQVNQLIEQRWAMLSNPHFADLPEFTKPNCSDIWGAIDGVNHFEWNQSWDNEQPMWERWKRFYERQWANRN